MYSINSWRGTIPRRSHQGKRKEKSPGSLHNWLYTLAISFGVRHRRNDSETPGSWGASYSSKRYVAEYRVVY